LIQNIYNDNRFLLSPVVIELLSKHGTQVLDLKSNEIDLPGEETGDDN